MSQKRPMSQFSQSQSKRARTLTNEVQQLKKQVRANKKELKYYDFDFTATGVTGVIDNESFFLSGVPRATFIGRKFHVKKIELQVLQTAAPSFIPENVTIWRESRPGKSVDLDKQWSTNLDPEYHTLLRHWYSKNNIDVETPKYVIDFGKSGRLVEFDNTTNGVASGNITNGDIKMNIRFSTGGGGDIESVATCRVWYTDG